MIWYGNLSLANPNLVVWIAIILSINAIGKQSHLSLIPNRAIDEIDRSYMNIPMAVHKLKKCI